MKKREQPKNGRKLIYIVMVLLGLIAGCAGPQLTPEQVTQINVECNDNATCIIEKTDAAMESLLVQLEYERQDRLTQRRDACVSFLNACDNAKGLVIVEVIKSGRSQLPSEREQLKARKEYGYSYTHDNIGKYARKTDFLCMYPKDIMRALGY